MGEVLALFQALISIDLLDANEFILLLFMVLAHAPPFWMSTLYSKYWRTR